MPVEVTLKPLVGKLNRSARMAMEAAAFCVARSHYDIEIEHYLFKLLEDPADTDAGRILRRFGVNRDRFVTDLGVSLDSFKRGNSRTPAIAPSLLKMLSEGWRIASLEFGAATIRTGITILVLVSDNDLRRLLGVVIREFSKIDPAVLLTEFASIVGGSVEDAEMRQAAPTAPIAFSNGAFSRTPNLEKFTSDLTANARAGKIDPGARARLRIRQIVDILMRRRQNNPILTGEAGVGKTAVVEGFATRVVSGDVPPALLNVSVRSLDLALLQAGAGVKGEFENRLKGLIEEVSLPPHP